MSSIFVFGDSITYGAHDVDGGWVQRVRSELDKRFLSGEAERHNVFNLGISGNTSENLLERIEHEYQVRSAIRPDRKNAIIIAIGINDSVYLKEEGQRRFAPEEFSSNIQELLNIAKSFSTDVALVGLNPVIESQVNPIPWDTSRSYLNEYVEEFDDILKAIAEKKAVTFIDVFSDWKTRDLSALMSDGLHPNEDGHALVAKLVLPYVLSVLS